MLSVCVVFIGVSSRVVNETFAFVIPTDNHLILYTFFLVVYNVYFFCHRGERRVFFPLCPLRLSFLNFSCFFSHYQYLFFMKICVILWFERRGWKKAGFKVKVLGDGR